MKSYVVSYRLKGSPFKKTINNVIEDGLVDSGYSRYFVCQDNSRIEIPLTAEIFFGPDRYELIQENITKSKLEEAEGGQSIPGIAFPPSLG